MVAHPRPSSMKQRLLTLIALSVLLLRCMPTGGFTIPLAPENCTDGPGENALTFAVSEKESSLMVDGEMYLVSFAAGSGVQAPATFIDDITIFFSFPPGAAVDDCGSFGGPISISSS